MKKKLAALLAAMMLTAGASASVYAAPQPESTQVPYIVTYYEVDGEVIIPEGGAPATLDNGKIRSADGTTIQPRFKILDLIAASMTRSGSMSTCTGDFLVMETNYTIKGTLRCLRQSGSGWAVEKSQSFSNKVQTYAPTFKYMITKGNTYCSEMEVTIVDQNGIPRETARIQSYLLSY